jgi:hypothetical protein
MTTNKPIELGKVSKETKTQTIGPTDNHFVPLGDRNM